MSPMTSRTGPRGRSETTLVAVAVAETVEGAESVGIVLVIPIQSLFPHQPTQRPLWTCVSRANDFESVRTKKIRPTCIIEIYWARGAAQEPSVADAAPALRPERP